MPTKEIKFSIDLDKRNLPKSIQWEATDLEDGEQTSDSMMIFLWDKQAQNSMSIDLWTREMTVHEMNVHFFQNLVQMADIFERATNNTEASEMIKQFANDFAEKLKEKKKW